jgi:hypothetical protein
MTEAQRRYQREWRKKHPGYMRKWMRCWRAVPENKAKERLRPWYDAPNMKRDILGVTVAVGNSGHKQ